MNFVAFRGIPGAECWKDPAHCLESGSICVYYGFREPLVGFSAFTSLSRSERSFLVCSCGILRGPQVWRRSCLQSLRNLEWRPCQGQFLSETSLLTVRADKLYAQQVLDDLECLGSQAWLTDH